MKQSFDSVRAVVFDLDDTLYSELDYVRSGFRAVAAVLASDGDAAWPGDANLEGPGENSGNNGEERHDAGSVFELLWSAFQGTQRGRVFNTVLKQLGRDDDAESVSALVTAYRCHRPSLQMGGSVRDMLTRLRGRYKLGLLTDGFMPAQQLKVESLGLTDAFDEIVYTEELGREFWKPSPRPFELISERLGCAASECVYVADNPTKDFIAPNELGWQTVQFKPADGVYRRAQCPIGGQAQVVIGNILELEDLLAQRP